MRRLLEVILVRNPRRPVVRPRAMCRVPEPPIGFVRRSDPNFFFLARKY
ncbi:MAG TPA: hypothetical protein VMT30_00415 [Candidatus Saccharimonadia bacterium]|nr:hypothetical protein [Candidatus Saccharimonadia bacterium]